MKKSILKILLIVIVLIFGIVLQDRAQDYALILKISETSQQITKATTGVQVRVVEKYNNGSEKISETYIKDGVYVTRRIDGKNTPSNSLEWASTNTDLICNFYSEYEYELDGETIKELSCGYNHASGSDTQATTRMAIGNLLLMYDKDIPASSGNMSTNIFNMPNIEDAEYNGKACYLLKTEYKNWYVEKESLKTLAIECKLFEDDSPCFYTFEYDIESPEGIYEAPNVSNTYYNKVEFLETFPDDDKYQNINSQKEKAISGTNLKPGEELIEVIELKENEKLNFLELTSNEFGLNGFNINTLETYNKFREKYSGLRELTEEDFEEYYVGIVYKEGYKLNYLQSLPSTTNNLVNYIFNVEKSQKDSLVLIVTPITEDSFGSKFIKNNEKFNITEDDASKLAIENITELSTEFSENASWGATAEITEIVVLDNELFAGLDVIKTPVKGSKPYCWKITMMDYTRFLKVEAYIDAITGNIIGAKTGESTEKFLN